MHTIGCDITEALKHISNEEYNLLIKKNRRDGLFIEVAL